MAKNNRSNSFLIIQEHINYIKRIRENELLDLIDRYKKSMILDNDDEDIFDFLDNIDSSVQKSVDKFNKYIYYMFVWVYVILLT